MFQVETRQYTLSLSSFNQFVLFLILMDGSKKKSVSIFNELLNLVNVVKYLVRILGLVFKATQLAEMANKEQYSADAIKSGNLFLLQEKFIGTENFPSISKETGWKEIQQIMCNQHPNSRL